MRLSNEHATALGIDDAICSNPQCGRPYAWRRIDGRPPCPGCGRWVNGVESAKPHFEVQGETEKVRPANLNTKGQNKTEARFDRWLAELKDAGRIAHYEFETIKLRLADRTWYKPDFDVWLPDDRLLFVEVKGTYIRDDANDRIKIAPEQHRFPFFLAVYDKGWTIRQMPSRFEHGHRITIFD